VSAELAPEMSAGRRLLNAFCRYPGVIHTLMGTPLGWRAFAAFCRGNLSMASVIQRPGIRVALALFRA
jgi:hypothetical protein